MASINAEVSTNPYRYGGKEWLMQEGLNYYDFAARQYDPTTGRFIHPDPLNGKYPHLSSYLYCAGNPINATDPSGMKWDYSNMTEKERLDFIKSIDVYKETFPELVKLYQLIDKSPIVIFVEYKNEISTKTPEGDKINVSIKLVVSNDNTNRTLFISKTLNPAEYNLAEDFFHCYQQCNLSSYPD